MFYRSHCALWTTKNFCEVFRYIFCGKWESYYAGPTGDPKSAWEICDGILFRTNEYKLHSHPTKIFIGVIRWTCHFLSTQNLSKSWIFNASFMNMDSNIANGEDIWKFCNHHEPTNHLFSIFASTHSSQSGQYLFNEKILSSINRPRLDLRWRKTFSLCPYKYIATVIAEKFLHQNTCEKELVSRNLASTKYVCIRWLCA